MILKKYLIEIKKIPSKLLWILLFSFLLNVWGINWGLPATWHPDEITPLAIDMVNRKSLNPNYFAYGTLHYYEVIAFAVIPTEIVRKILKVFRGNDTKRVSIVNDFGNKQINSFSPINNKPWLWEGAPFLLARILSALLGTGIVLLVYLLSKTLFDLKTALISSFLLASAMGFVIYSHFATVDISSTFWFTLSCLMSVYLWSREERKWYLLAGLTVGLAAAVKYVGGLAIIPLIIAHLFKEKKNNSNLIIAILMVIAGFFIGCPIAIFSFFEFIDGFTKEFFFNTIRIIDNENSYAFYPLLLNLKESLGLPLFLISIGGLFYSIKFLRIREERAKIVLLYSMFLPYYLSMGSHNVAVLWYVVPLIPFFCIWAGKMFSVLLNFKVKTFHMASLILFTIVISYSVIYTISADLQLVRDSRYITKEWILNNAPVGSKIEIAESGVRLPDIPHERYSIVKRPESWNQTDWIYPVIQNRDKNKAYVLIRKASTELELLLQKIGLIKQHKPYIAWYERGRDLQASKNFDYSLKGLELRNPDYLVLSYINPDHFVKNSDEYQFYDLLFSGKTIYREAAQVKTSTLSWFDAKIPFVNPKIFIFKKEI